MDFSVEHSVTTDDILVVTIAGPMDLATVPRLRDPLIRLIDKGHYQFMLEMSAVDSSTR